MGYLYYKNLTSTSNLKSMMLSHSIKSIYNNAVMSRLFEISIMDDSDFKFLENTIDNNALYTIVNDSNGASNKFINKSTKINQDSILKLRIDLPYIFKVTKINCKLQNYSSSNISFNYDSIGVIPSDLSENYPYYGITGTNRLTVDSSDNSTKTIFEGHMYCYSLILKVYSRSTSFWIYDLSFEGEILLENDIEYDRKEEFPDKDDIVETNHFSRYVDNIKVISSRSDKSVELPKINLGKKINKTDILAVQSAINSLEEKFSNNCATSFSQICQSCQESCVCQSQRCQSCQEHCVCQSCQSARQCNCVCHADNDEE